MYFIPPSPSLPETHHVLVPRKTSHLSLWELEAHGSSGKDVKSWHEKCPHMTKQISQNSPAWASGRASPSLGTPEIPSCVQRLTREWLLSLPRSSLGRESRLHVPSLTRSYVRSPSPRWPFPLLTHKVSMVCFRVLRQFHGLIFPWNLHFWSSRITYILYFFCSLQGSWHNARPPVCE